MRIGEDLWERAGEYYNLPDELISDLRARNIVTLAEAQIPHSEERGRAI